MKLKLFVLLLAVCLVLIGCDSAESKKPAATPTTVPAQGTSDTTGNTETPVPSEPEDALTEVTLPKEIQGIELPLDEFPDDDTPPVPVTKPSEPEQENTYPPVVPQPEDPSNELPLHEFE